MSNSPNSTLIRTSWIAWPMGLHGVAAATLIQVTFQTTQAGALKGLKADSAGARSLAPTTRWECNQFFFRLPIQPVPAFTAHEPIHVFTDGSCHDQHNAATWAVVLASTEGVHDYTGSALLDSGLLPIAAKLCPSGDLCNFACPSDCEKPSPQCHAVDWLCGCCS